MSEYAPTEYRTSQEQKHTLRDILVIFFRRRWVIAAVSVPIIAFAIVGTLNTVDTFTASSQVLIEGVTAETPTFKNLNSDHDVMMSTAGQVASSIPVARKAAVALIDSLEILRQIDPRFVPVETAEEMQGFILGRIHCSQVAESDILSINYTDPNPRVALILVGAVTKAYVEYNAESKNNDGATQYYTEQVERLQGEIERLIDKRAAIYREGGLNAFQVNNNAAINHMRQMEHDYLKLKAKRSGLEARVQLVHESIAADPLYVPMMQGNSNTTMLGGFSDYNKARLALEEMKLSFNDSAVVVKRQREFLETTRKMFLKERDGFVKNLEEELRSATLQEQSLFEAYQQYKDQIMAFPDLEGRISALDVEIQAQRKLLEALQVKRGEVRMQAESDLRVSNIVPLNVPTIVAGVGGGKKMIYIVLASFLAIVLGLVVALFIDVNDHKIYSRRQAEDVLEIPVLGSISEISSSQKT